MASNSDYALMAGVSYRTTRADLNKFPIPTGWTEVLNSHVALPSGFEAVTFRNDATGELVISFAGTNNLRDWTANIGLGTGAGTDQLRDATDYYLTILTTHGGSNPNAPISFTGHSLGGGLAALMGVFFNKKAVTFDQAPFANSATTAIRDDLVSYLTLNGYSSNLNTLAPALASYTDLAQRAGNVTGVSVAGEILSSKMVEFFLSRIGAQSQLTHGSYFGPIDLHAQSLLSAFVLNDGFRQVTFTLTDLLPMVFDGNLYYNDPNKLTNPLENLLERLIRHQIGNAPGVTVANQMLDRFTADLQKVAATSGLAVAGDLTKALIAFAMQMYYSGPNATDADKQLYTLIGGGINFDRSDVADSLGGMKGYSLYFQNYLATLPTDVQTIANTMLGELLDWYLAGTRLIAAATTKTAFMLGAGEMDSLTGSTQADLLVGLGGNDILMGGQGNDVLVGGDGFDTYLYRVGDGNDRIIDSDKQGRILVASAAGVRFYDTTALIRDKDNPNLWSNADGQVRMTHGGTWQLQIGGGSIDLGDTFTDGDYGIDLRDAPTEITPVNTVTGDQNTNKNDALYGTAGSDLIDGLTANDLVFGGAGDDKLLGGAGDDDIVGEADDDLVIGGAGNDRLGGNAGHDRLYAEDETPLADAIAAQDGTPTALRGDWLAGSHGDDRLVGSSGNDILFGGKDDDIIIGGTGDDTIEGDLEVTWVYADWDVQRQVTTSNGVTAYSRAYLGMEGFDSSQAGDDSIYAGGGADWVFAGAGADWIDGGTGDDVVFGENGADILAGGAGDDVLDGDVSAEADGGGHGSDLVYGGDGADKLWGNGGDDHLSGDGGNDELMGDSVRLDPQYHGNDTLDGGVGNDSLHGQGGNDTLIGGDGDDHLDGDYDPTKLAGQHHGNDTLDGGAGNDTLIGDGGDDSLFGGDGDDVLAGDQSENVPLDTQYHGNDLLDGGAGNDLLVGDSGDDTLIGGEGDDTLRGSEGDDSLDGGLGVDLLEGGAGNDIYILAAGDGQAGADGIVDSGGDDTLVIGAAVTDVWQTPEGLMAIQYDNSDLVAIENSGTSIEHYAIGGETLSYAELIGRYSPDVIIATDQQGIQHAAGGYNNDVLQIDADNAILSGGRGNDTIYAYSGGNTFLFSSGDGNDTIKRSATNINGNPPNILQFGDGVSPGDITTNRSDYDLVLTNTTTADTVTIFRFFFYNEDPNSTENPVQQVKFADGTVWGITELTRGKTLTGTPDNDIIAGTWGADIIDGQAGDDQLDGGQGNDALSGGDGNDFLHGGSGNDILDGGAGSDLLFGDAGNDTYLFGRGDGQDRITYDPNGNNTLQFKAGIAPVDLIMNSSGGYSLTIQIVNTIDQITLDDFWHNGYINTNYNPVDQFKFEDGTTWDLPTIQARLFAGTSWDDRIQGTYGNDIINGQGGNDFIFSSDGDDTLDGGDGDDTLSGEAGNDTLVGGAGNDYLSGGYGIDTLLGGAGDDTMSGRSGIFDGGAGNDTIAGSSYPGYACTYLFGKGDGQDTIRSAYYEPFTGDWINVLQFREGVLPTEIVLKRSYSNLVLYVAGNEDKVTVDRFFTDGDPANRYNPIQQVAFSDGSSWDIAEIVARLQANRTPVLSIALLDQSAAQGVAFNYAVASGSFTDPDFDDFLTYSASLADGGALPAWLNFDSVTGTFSGTPTALDTTSVRVTATDVEGLSASDVFDIMVSVQDLVLNGTAAADTLSGYAGNDTLNGNAGNDILYGNAGNDFLNGGTGSDKMYGGTGNDTYVVDTTSDTVTENADEGTDLVQSSITYTLGANVENLTLTGTTAINGTGNTLDNLLAGNSANNTLSGGAGADTLIGGAGNDTYVVDNIGDVVTENDNEGTDLVQSSVTHTLGDNVENLTLTGTTAINGTGNALDNTLTGNSANNILTGGAGNDTLNGGTGNDTMVGGVGNDIYVVNATGDVVTESVNEGTDLVQSSVTYTLSANVENLTLTGTSTISGTGNALDNVLTGNSASNTLNGGTGADTLIGKAGNDTYVVDNTGDMVTEIDNEGTDLVQSSITYTLGNNVENLTLTGTTAIDGTGNDLNNILTGNAAVNTLSGGVGNDTLNGGTGADTLIGGADNDTYVVDNTGDMVNEIDNEGTDLVQSSITYTLGNNIENLTLTGTSTISGTGNVLDNVLTGNSASNTLNGGTGADTLIGKAGNDTYVVDNTGDLVTEIVNEGTDLVQSSITYTLGNNVENLTLTGTIAINGTGNDLNNILTGNAAVNTLSGGVGNDTLNGGIGTDTLIGGAGNDTYVVDNIGDVVTENDSEGTDLIQSSVTYTLSANVENLTLTGTIAINGTGNALDNLLTGNSVNNMLTGDAGNDTLDGGSGSDTMAGGTGNDIYVVNIATDTITENANEGTDTIRSSVTLTLGNNVENLTLTGTSAISGTGNALDNVLTGNSAINTLNGNAGNDTLDGGAGTDSLVGGAGNDSYILGRGYGADSVTENDSTAGNTDIASFLAGVATDQIWFRHVGNNLEASIIGTSDSLTIQNWYSGSTYHVEQFKTADNRTLLDTQVENLVQAMAAFAPPAAGQTTLPPAYQTALAPVIAANWQ